MTDELAEVEAWAGAVLSQLEPGQRRQLARLIGRDVNRSQRTRIKSQLNPDGSPFEARKAQPSMRDRKGQIRRTAKAGPMFSKLSRARELGVLEASADQVSVGFRRARSSAIARVHQEGLVDQVARKDGAARVRYARRQLLGLTDADRTALADRIVSHISADG